MTAARALLLIAIAVAGCGSKRGAAARRDAGNGSGALEPVRPKATRHDRIAPIDLAEVTPLLPALPFLAVKQPLRHIQRMQRLEAAYCSAQAADQVASQLTAALGAAGWLPGAAPRSSTSDTRVVAQRDRYRFAATLTAAAAGACAAGEPTAIQIVVFKVSGEP